MCPIFLQNLKRLSFLNNLFEGNVNLLTFIRDILDEIIVKINFTNGHPEHNLFDLSVMLQKS